MSGSGISRVEKAKTMCHLHTHTEFSVFDGCGKQENFIKKAQQLGMPAIALTEHGSMRGVYKQSETCREISKDLGAGLSPIKPIFGIEFYLCDSMFRRGFTKEEEAEIAKDVPRSERSETIYQAEVAAGIRARFHLTALAMDGEGLKNLYKLSSMAWVDGYWKRPRIDLKTLYQHNKGIIVLSGCLSGAINHYLIKGDVNKAISQAEELKHHLGDRFYLELMSHSVKDQDVANQGLLRLSAALDIPIVATQDAHWIDDTDAPVQEVLLCIHTKKTMSMPPNGDIKTGRFKFDTDEFWFKTRSEMEETFNRNHGGYMTPALIKRALDSTLEINERITAELKIDRKQGMVPKIPMPPEFSGVLESGEPDPEEEYKFMVHLCVQGWMGRGLEERIEQQAKKHKMSLAAMTKKYRARLLLELAAIKKQNAVRYFLVIWRMYNWARSKGIECGPGRGSAGGVLVSFLMYITDIDPLEYGLLFERFLSPERVDLPDVDCDFESERREEIIQYLRDTYGEDKTCQIATIGTLKGKQCLIDIARVLEIPDQEVREVTQSIVERSSGDERASQTIEDAFKDFDVCRKFNQRHPEVLELAKKLEGQARNLGIHAAGVIVCPVPITDVAPIEIRKINERQKDAPVVKVSAFDMYGSAAVGLMKIDILGIRNLDTIRSCREMIKNRHGVIVDWDTIDMNDAAVLGNFTAHSFIGIFQFDTPAADKISEGVKFTSFEDVAAMIALDRPGTARSGLATEYLKRKQNPKMRKSIHPIVDEICSDTLGVIVYQEHVTRIFVELAGFSPATADSLRKKIAKKWGDEAIGKERENFVKGAVARGCSKELAEDLISKITFFGSYGFNKSHSIAYGLTGYRQMWLKTYYPTDYMWALLKHEPDRGEVSRFVKECHRLGVPVRPAEVNHSTAEWAIDDNGEIVASLIDLKGVAENTVKEIELKRPFRNFVDFAHRIDRRRVNRAHVQVLLKSGAMRNMVPNQKWALEHVQELWDTVAKGKPAEAARMLLESAELPDFTADEAQIVSSEVNPLSFGKHPMEPYNDFLENKCVVPWLSMGDEDLYKKGDGWVNGIVLEVKYNQIGDFHTGPPPTDDEKRRQKWGARYANINVEDISGKQNRMKVDHDIFDAYRHIVDKKQGTVIAAHVNLGAKFKNMRAHFVVDLEALRKKVKGCSLSIEEIRSSLLITGKEPEVEELFSWEEKLLIGAHPASRFGAKRETLKSGRIRVTGIVTHLNVKLDKKYNEMAFFGVHHGSGYVDVMSFASAWPEFKEMIKPGRILRAVFKPTDRGDGFILDNDVSPAVKLLE